MVLQIALGVALGIFALWLLTGAAALILAWAVERAGERAHDAWMVAAAREAREARYRRGE